MKLSIIDITSRPDSSETHPYDMGMSEITISGNTYPVHIEPFDVCLSMEGTDRLHVSFSTALTVTASCDRCLEDTDISMDIECDELLDIADGAVVSDEDIGDYSFVCEEGLDVDRLIYDEILVGWPSKILCKDDCKGLCPVCGKNKNVTDCGCDDTVLDPRMAQFQDIFNQYKEV